MKILGSILPQAVFLLCFCFKNLDFLAILLAHFDSNTRHVIQVIQVIQPLRGMESQEKEAQKRLQDTGNLFRKNLQLNLLILDLKPLKS